MKLILKQQHSFITNSSVYSFNLYLHLTNHSVHIGSIQNFIFTKIFCFFPTKALILYFQFVCTPSSSSRDLRLGIYTVNIESIQRTAYFLKPSYATITGKSCSYFKNCDIISQYITVRL